MPVRYEHVEIVRTSPDRAFAAIDDLPLTSNWLPPCVSLEKVGSGPNAPGDKLRYVYKQGGKTGEMSGEIIARTPGQRLHCKYFDSAFNVSVDLRVAANAEGALTTHIIEITPNRFLAKLMSPMIRLGLGKQTREAAANLKKLLESTAAGQTPKS
jgi:Polyketide cyclase / dehydrase and lipid transport